MSPAVVQFFTSIYVLNVVKSLKEKGKEKRYGNVSLPEGLPSIKLENSFHRKERKYVVMAIVISSGMKQAACVLCGKKEKEKVKRRKENVLWMVFQSGREKVVIAFPIHSSKTTSTGLWDPVQNSTSLSI